MSDETEDQQNAQLGLLWGHILLNFMKALKFLTGIGIKFVIGQVFIYFIKQTEISLTDFHTTFLGFQVHEIAGVFELTVFMTFLVMATIEDLGELLAQPIGWIVAKLKGNKS